MDCQMPEMDGYDATRAIRAGKAGEENKQLPIIAMTANAMQGDRQKCTDAGMDDYISKPINLSILKSTVIKWILKDETSVTFSTDQTITEQTAPIDFPIWDEENTLKRLGNNTELLRKIIESFMNDGLKSLAALRTALEENNSEDAQLYAHALKGSAGNVGALKLQEIAKHLEEAAKNKNLNDVQAGFEECENILNETLVLFKINLTNSTQPLTRTKRFDPLQMAIKLQSLKKDLENGVYIDTEVLGIFVDYSDEAFSANMKTLKEHIERFKSDQAILTLKRIMAGLE
jgi:CheY-like chemotaxis protein